MATEFPQAATWQALRFNQLVLGFDRPRPRAQLTRLLRAGPRRLEPLRALLARDLRPARPAARPWTDDRAPVEWVTDRMILGYALRSGRIEGPALPTEPP